ncbi:pyruvate dehydrogenase complex dihydrolipoamide acetyltransferase [Methylobacterium haplocladii]|uniref:Acetyltransferase component of pyruvate dehydrogenase complex n=2 Tax=Methylobacterium haplocladii TaxID=1176176 RepID=A0A512ITS2_9HYPH|nr:pyruvate dehydrogenase complex dihydrolipoamide acetyltransferase [Methylobacterium haplocladii]GEP01066.1 dihydrolipoyllysine-residue acetyltransferase component of pyruvate dehydrogenase complex [Methylobacterium haplocladii]GJD85630.1 Dihydrolipoyllysine-residue acetyltransferase component of pyruvate dehydrogenase complex [Methylobacterium haplocladii]
MPINVLMPALSPTMEKGNLAKWLKKEGDTVRSGDILAEIETDKATMEVEAIDEGILAKIVVPEGTADVPVNDLIALIAGEGEDPAGVTAASGSAPAVKTAAKPAQTADANVAPGGGHREDARVDAAPEGARTNGAAEPAKTRVFASPLARRIAGQEGIDLSALKGSGPHGRVIAADVQAAKAAGTGKPTPTTTTAPKAASTPPAPAAPAAGAPAGLGLDQVRGFYKEGTYEEVPLDGMRKTIAKRLTEAMQVAPHFYLTVDCEIDALMGLREQINRSAGKDRDGKPAFKLSVNDFIIKAMGLALTRVPAANAVWAVDRVLRFKHAEVGVAVAIDGGLFTPVIREADRKTLSTISNEMKDFAARARAKKLKPEEYQGGVTSVSNLGMFGIKHFTAVINPPQSSILAVGAGEKRIVVRDGAPAVAQVMTATLSCDHRVLDGALGAELIAAFKGLIENPMGMLV